MSIFDELMSDLGVNHLMHALGEAGWTYTPAGGSPVSLTAIAEAKKTEEDETLDGRRRRRVRTVSITTDPNSDYGGVASPSIEATMTSPQNVEYAVEEIESLSASMARLRLRRRDQLERSRPDYRAK